MAQVLVSFWWFQPQAAFQTPASWLRVQPLQHWCLSPPSQQVQRQVWPGWRQQGLRSQGVLQFVQRAPKASTSVAKLLSVKRGWARVSNPDWAER